MLIVCGRCTKEFEPLSQLGRWSCRHHPGELGSKYPGGPLLYSCCGRTQGVGSALDVRGCTPCDHQLPLGLEQPVVWIPHLVPGVQPRREAIVATIDAHLDPTYFEAAAMLYRTMVYADTLPTKTLLGLKAQTDKIIESQKHASSWDPPGMVSYYGDGDDDGVTHPPPSAPELTFVYEYWARFLKRAPLTLTKLMEGERLPVKVDVIRRSAPH